MKFNIKLLIDNDIISYNQLKLKYGNFFIKQYPYQLTLNNKRYFSLEQLYKLFPDEILNSESVLSYNRLSEYITYSPISTNIFLHDIDYKTKTSLKNNLRSMEQDNNQYKITDLIEDEHYILHGDILIKYNLYVCYLNDYYILLSFINKVHKYLLSLEAKDLLNDL